MRWYCVVLIATLLACNVWAGEAERIIDESGVRGGLVVVAGSDPDLLAAFAEIGPYVVQGLGVDRREVEDARSRLTADRLYGPVTVKHWTTDHLPYADGVVNLLVAPGSERPAPSAEIMRVLAPRGVAMVGGRKVVKAVPPEIDEWSHLLHGPGNNAVAADSVVGPPRFLKWTGGPKYSRNHEIDSSVVA